MKKIKNKFLVLQIDCNLDKVAEQLNINQYTESKGVGVSSRKLDKDKIFASFVEKKTITEEVNYPNGTVESIESVKYIYFDFKIRLIKENYFLIQLFNAPLSIKTFIFYLSDLFPSLAIEKFKFNLFTFRNRLKENKSFNKVRITSLKASSLPFSDKSVARIEVFSENDSFHELKKAYGERGYKLDRLVFTINNAGQNSELSASSTGSITFTESLNEEIIIESFSRSINF
ncbi:hypothetical protein AAEI00_02665 [Shewanella algae]|uniref:hypothetical protein n=1 Tax=Shewanella algae TaxID=38313 RepID=UPI001AAF2D7C|nr:hypothetical protein [Shewanella algae]MBO2580313.1 hypothetical protein [Shewanella algae]